MANLTPFARKYASAPPHQQTNPFVIKSLLTPLSPSNITSNQDSQAFEAAELYQREILNGYTTRELMDLDAITYRELKPTSLQNPINQIIGRDRWTLGDWPPHQVAGGIGNGHWESTNDLAWSQLEPCLRLASRLFADMHKHPWFDAFMLGDREKIDESRFPVVVKLQTNLQVLQLKFKTFKLREPGPKNAEECLSVIQALTRTVFWKYVRLGFKSQSRLPANLQPLFSGISPSELNRFTSSHGLTYFHNDTGMIDIWLSFEMVEPLLDLNDDLTSAEKLALQLRVAIVIIHELMHTFFHARFRYHGYNNFNYIIIGLPEPYFMDEPISEAGWSADNAMFGGLTQPFLPAPTPPLALKQHNYPRSRIGAPLELTSPSFPTTQIISPLPVTFYESLHSEEFWTAHFRNYGYLRLKPVSMSWKWMNGPENSWKIVKAHDLEIFSEPHPTGRAVADLLDLTPGERFMQAQQMRSDAVQTLQAEINRRRERVTELLAEAEICARSVGNPEYLNLLMNLVQVLGTMVASHANTVSMLFGLEKGRSAPLVDQRNDFQGFNRHLRQFTSQYLGSGHRPLEDRINALLGRIEGLRLLLSPGPENATGIIETGALTQSTQAEVNENELLATAIHAADAGDRDTARAICNQLLSSLGCNLFAQACCRIVLASDDSIPAADRLKDVHRALNTLLIITPPPEWQEELQRAIETARESIDTLTALVLDDIDNLQICCMGN